MTNKEALRKSQDEVQAILRFAKSMKELSLATLIESDCKKSREIAVEMMDRAAAFEREAVVLRLRLSKIESEL